MRRTKFLALLLVAILCMTMFPVSAAAAADGIDVEIQLDKETVYPGDEVTATVYLTQNAGFTMLVFDVDYDEAVFEYVSGSTVYNTSVLSGGMEAPENSTRLGWMLADETSNTTATGAVATLTFKAIATGTASFSISVPQVGGAITWDYETVSLTSQPTSVTVSVNPSTCSHSYQQTSKTDATCAQTGSITYTCSLCGNVKTDTIKKNSHTYGLWTVDKAATCTATGTQIRTCSVCGDKETAEIAATGHSYGSWTVTKAATCTATGTEQRVCAHDKTHVETRSIQATGHNYGSWKTVTVATCTSSGTEKRVCANDSSHVETRTINALGHSYDSGEITKPATTTSTGVKTYTCTRCSGSCTETIPQLTSTLALGDVNGDGQVNLKDVTLLFQYVNKQISSLKHPEVSDINHDGSINLKDVTKLFQYVNKQISSL